MNTPQPASDGSRIRIIWIILILALVAVGGAAALSFRLKPKVEIEKLGPSPEFTLTSQAGVSYASSDLDGRVWLADFMFTTCQGICPILTQRMLEMQALFADRPGWGLVSFSVDPTTDTPEVLTAYATEHGADLDRWVFLTGDKREIFNIISEGFHLVVEEGAGDSVEPTLHSPRIVLVDTAGEIRGYYDALDEESMARLKRDMGELLNAGGS